MSSFPLAGRFRVLTYIYFLPANGLLWWWLSQQNQGGVMITVFQLVIMLAAVAAGLACLAAGITLLYWRGAPGQRIAGTVAIAAICVLFFSLNTPYFARAAAMTDARATMSDIQSRAAADPLAAFAECSEISDRETRWKCSNSMIELFEQPEDCRIYVFANGRANCARHFIRTRVEVEPLSNFCIRAGVHALSNDEYKKCIYTKLPRPYDPENRKNKIPRPTFRDALIVAGLPDESGMGIW